MLNIIKQKIVIDEILKKKIEIICEFSNTYPQIINVNIRKICKTNLTYVDDKIKNATWHNSVNCSKFIAKIIVQVSKNESITPYLHGDPDVVENVQKKLTKKLYK